MGRLIKKGVIHCLLKFNELYNQILMQNNTNNKKVVNGYSDVDGGFVSKNGRILPDYTGRRI